MGIRGGLSMQVRNMTPTPMQIQGYTVPQRMSHTTSLPHKQTQSVNWGYLGRLGWEITVAGLKKIFTMELACVLVIVLSICGIYTLVRMDAQMGYDVSRLERQINASEQKHRELEYNVSKLKSPVRIQEIAEKEFGMVLPDTFIYSEDKMAVTRN